MRNAKRIADVDVRFSWADVDCFHRPQAMICDFVAPGRGEFYLYLTSIHKMWGLGEYFDSPGSLYFPFVGAVMPPRMGLSFNAHFLDEGHQLSNALKTLLEDGGPPVIVPANVRVFPGARDSGKSDAAHYFMVHGYDEECDSFIVCDNLRSGASSFGFEDVAVASGVLQDMVDLYVETHLAPSLPTPHRESRLWMLQISPDVGLQGWTEESMARRLLHDFLGVSRHPRTETSLCRAFDGRHIAYIQACKGGASQQAFKSAMREYIAEANFVAVHLSLVIRALERLGWGCAPQAFLDLDAYKRAATIARSNLLAACMTNSAAPDDFDRARERLLDLAVGVQTDFALHVERSGLAGRVEDILPALN